MTPDDGDAVRTWVAPHAGTVRIEGQVSVATAERRRCQRRDPARRRGDLADTNREGSKPLSHDLTARVAAGEPICFIVSKNAAAGGNALSRDPVVTYVRGECGSRDDQIPYPSASFGQ